MFSSPFDLLLYSVALTTLLEGNGMPINHSEKLQSKSVEQSELQMSGSSCFDLPRVSTVKNNLRVGTIISSQNINEKRVERSLADCQDPDYGTLTAERVITRNGLSHELHEDYSALSNQFHNFNLKDVSEETPISTQLRAGSEAKSELAKMKPLCRHKDSYTNLNGPIVKSKYRMPRAKRHYKEKSSTSSVPEERDSDDDRCDRPVENVHYEHPRFERDYSYQGKFSSNNGGVNRLGGQDQT